MQCDPLTKQKIEPEPVSNPDLIWGVWLKKGSEQRWCTDTFNGKSGPRFFEEREEAIAWRDQLATTLAGTFEVRRNNVPASNYDKPAPVAVPVVSAPKVWGIWYTGESNPKSAAWCTGNSCTPEFFATKEEAETWRKANFGIHSYHIVCKVDPLDASKPSEWNKAPAADVGPWQVWITAKDGETSDSPCNSGQEYFDYDKAKETYNWFVANNPHRTYEIRKVSTGKVVWPAKVQEEKADSGPWQIWMTSKHSGTVLPCDGGHKYTTLDSAKVGHASFIEAKSGNTFEIRSMHTKQVVLSAVAVALTVEAIGKPAEMWGIWYEDSIHPNFSKWCTDQGHLMKFDSKEKAESGAQYYGWKGPSYSVQQIDPANTSKPLKVLKSRKATPARKAQPEHWGVWYDGTGSEEGAKWCSHMGQKLFPTKAEAESFNKQWFDQDCHKVCQADPKDLSKPLGAEKPAQSAAVSAPESGPWGVWYSFDGIEKWVAGCENYMFKAGAEAAIKQLKSKFPQWAERYTVLPMSAHSPKEEAAVDVAPIVAKLKAIQAKQKLVDVLAAKVAAEPVQPAEEWGVWIEINYGYTTGHWAVGYGALDDEKTGEIFFPTKGEAQAWQVKHQLTKDYYVACLKSSKVEPVKEEPKPEETPWGIWFDGPDPDEHYWCGTGALPGGKYPSKQAAEDHFKILSKNTFGKYTLLEWTPEGPAKPEAPKKFWGVWIEGGIHKGGQWCGQGEMPLGKYPTKEAAEKVYDLLKGSQLKFGATLSVLEWTPEGPQKAVEPVAPGQLWGVWFTSADASVKSSWCKGAQPGKYSNFKTKAEAEAAKAGDHWWVTNPRITVERVDPSDPTKPLKQAPKAEEVPLVAPVTAEQAEAIAKPEPKTGKEKANAKAWAKKAKNPEIVYGLWWEGLYGWNTEDEDDQPGWMTSEGGKEWTGTLKEAKAKQKKMGSRFHVQPRIEKTDWKGHQGPPVDKWGVWFERAKATPEDAPGWCTWDEEGKDLVLFSTYAEALHEADERCEEGDVIYPWGYSAGMLLKKQA
jgi:hypothetical protein